MGRYASAREFFSVTYGPGLRLRFRNAPPLQAGDILILVGLHLTTRDIPDWVWATFWWTEDGRPTSGFGPATKAPPPWNRYDMDLTLSMTFPKSFGNISVKRIFNPYLEAALSSGLASNCMTCHSIAAYPIYTGDKIFEDGHGSPINLFESRVTTDFLWSVAQVLSQ
jgi:hypothetical protein